MNGSTSNGDATPDPVYVGGKRGRRNENDAMRTWKALGVILAVLVGAGTVAMGIGKAFYVTREEYSAKERSDVVVGETLKRMESQLSTQQAAFDRLSTKIVEMQTDLAVMRKRRP